MVARKASSLFNVKQRWGRGTSKRTFKELYSTEHGKSFKALCHQLSAATLVFQPKKMPRTITLEQKWAQLAPESHERCTNDWDSFKDPGYSSWTSWRQTSTCRGLHKSWSHVRSTARHVSLITTRSLQSSPKVDEYCVESHTCRLYHSSVISQGPLIHWEPCKTEEIPWNLTNPVWMWLVLYLTYLSNVVKKLELTSTSLSLCRKPKNGPVFEGGNHQENGYHTQVTVGSLKKKRPRSFSRAEIALIKKRQNKKTKSPQNPPKTHTHTQKKTHTKKIPTKHAQQKTSICPLYQGAFIN